MCNQSSNHPKQNPAGLVWTLLGVAILTLTLAGVGWVRLTDPLPPEGMLALLGLGSVPAALALFVGLGRAYFAKRKLVASATGPVRSPGLRVAGVGLGLLVLGVAIVTADSWRGQRQQQQWVAEAEAIVEDLLRNADSIPEEMRERLGAFERLTGGGYGGAAWNIQGYEYFSADRQAHFANATIPVKIFVTEGRITNPGSREVVVQEVAGDLLSLDAPMSKDTPIPRGKGLRIMVSHPELK